MLYEPFVRDLDRTDTPADWFIERVPTDRQLTDRIDEWKRLAAEGWNVTALVAPDSKTIVALGCRGELQEAA